MPRASETIYLSDEAMLQSEAKRMQANASFLDRLRVRFIRAWVQTDDGGMFRVKLAKNIREVWWQEAKRHKSADDGNAQRGG